MASHPASTIDFNETLQVHRVEVRSRAGDIDPHAAKLLPHVREAFPGVESVKTATVYLIESPLTDQQIQQVADELLADRVNQQVIVGAAAVEPSAAVIEVHYKPGVMDPVAQSARSAIEEMIEDIDIERVDLLTGTRIELVGDGANRLTEEQLTAFASRHLANPVIQDIFFSPVTPDAFPHGHSYDFKTGHIPLRDLDDDALERLSREAHLFLSLDEMRAIRDYYRQQPDGREPTDIELETLAQTWSEHCVHKTLKSKIRFRYAGEGDGSGGLVPHVPIDGVSKRPGHTINDDGSITIDNLLKSTIAAATFELMSKPPHDQWCISVFEDNAGIVAFDDTDAVCIKVETHNHPSAIEPYGGAATGIGGCIRDIMGTGLFARPIANTDVFAVADPNTTEIPKGVIHPRRILEQVVAGVRDYGNRMGIPTVNGAVVFHPGYLANPLVFAGCIGIMPRDKCFGRAKPGDRIIALGGATGRDGIHGATFSSAELTDTHADEFSHAVQIGNAITQKKTMDVILQARDHEDGCLYSAITDCGAGGFSSAVGEMGEKVGARVQLENAPLKYKGLSYTEIWISEAQERMVLAVPAENVQTLRDLCDAEDVGFCDLGEYGCYADGTETEPMLVLTFHGETVGELSMHLLHDGIPTPTREASWPPDVSSAMYVAETAKKSSTHDLGEMLHALLGHLDIASKHWIIRQYDHEVQGGSSVKPLVGPYQDGPSDASVLRPKYDSDRGVAIGCGLQPHLSEAANQHSATSGDSYWMTLAAIDEAVRNVVCVGADPNRIAILDNFCWPSCGDAGQLGTLVRAAEACYDGALAYGTPFVSGKDSLNNQFTTDDGRLIAIPQTLLITALAIVDDVKRCVTMDAKQPGDLLIVVGETDNRVGGSHAAMLFDQLDGDTTIPAVDLQQGPLIAQAVASLIKRGAIAAAHDCSDGGLLVAAAEMAMAARIGVDLDLATLPTSCDPTTPAACFAETPSRYLLEVPTTKLDEVVRALRAAKIPFAQVGRFADHDRITLRGPNSGRSLEESIASLHHSWRNPLDW